VLNKIQFTTTYVLFPILIDLLLAAFASCVKTTSFNPKDVCGAVIDIFRK